MTRWPLNRNLFSVRHIECFKVNSSSSNVFGSISAIGGNLKTVQQETTKTAVLMLHHGQPRTPYYATKHLAEGSHYYYKLPLWLTSYACFNSIKLYFHKLSISLLELVVHEMRCDTFCYHFDHFH